jgi:hypothetical protein
MPEGLRSAKGYARLALVIALGAVTASPATAQPPDSREHAADLSGVWTNISLPDAGPWAIYSFSEDPPSMTEWGLARFNASKPQRGPRGVPVSETDDLVYQCFPPGTPRIYLHPFPLEIIQTPGRVMIVYEYDHLVRQIHTDGRGHRTDLAPSWMGDSIGRWEGETLVVETTNFNDRTWLDRRGVPHSEEMTLIERFRLDADGNLQIDLRVEDPVALTEPWVARRVYGRTDWTIEELVCEDNATYTEFENAVLEFEGESDGESD